MVNIKNYCLHGHQTDLHNCNQQLYRSRASVGHHRPQAHTCTSIMIYYIILSKRTFTSILTLPHPTFPNLLLNTTSDLTQYPYLSTLPCNPIISNVTHHTVPHFYQLRKPVKEHGYGGPTLNSNLSNRLKQSHDI